MSGDSFCKLDSAKVEVKKFSAFNPHVWGLFLQEEAATVTKLSDLIFQSPCLGTLFASVIQYHYIVSLISIFQSPCLGTLFASGIAEREGVNLIRVFQSPCLGTLFARSESYTREERYN